MTNDKAKIRQAHAIVDKPANFPAVKQPDRQFLSQLLKAQERSGSTQLTGRQRNIITNIYKGAGLMTDSENEQDKNT